MKAPPKSAFDMDMLEKHHEAQTAATCRVEVKCLDWYAAVDAYTVGRCLQKCPKGHNLRHEAVAKEEYACDICAADILRSAPLCERTAIVRAPS